jgi:indolepyruvate ferredoxin oxidoreductase
MHAGPPGHVRDFTVPELLANAGDAVKRLPYFCAGCPHNTSTRVPEGSTRAPASAATSWPTGWSASTAGLIQMGGEGVDWVSHAMFTRVPHVFQNLGDGTYYHSGYLAIRQAVAARRRITYKILFNDAVAMTGGQPVDGAISVDAIARQVESEGVRAWWWSVTTSASTTRMRDRFPAGTEFHDREELDAVQRRLREMPGVTVLIYEQTCAAEKRRRRKKGELADPPQRLFINEAVCEGCGDCGVQSNCVAVLPHETAAGPQAPHRPEQLQQGLLAAPRASAPASSVRGGRLRRRAGILERAREPSWPAWPPCRARRRTSGPGPTTCWSPASAAPGVVTVGALVAMAAHLEGNQRQRARLHGLRAEGRRGAELRAPGRPPERLNQVRIDTQQADAVLACDLVVGASARGAADRAPWPHAHPGQHARDPGGRAPAQPRRRAAGRRCCWTSCASPPAPIASRPSTRRRWPRPSWATRSRANIVALGYAWQRGLVPVSLAALSARSS